VLAWTPPGQRLVTAGDNPGRLRSERSFARATGDGMFVAPADIEVSGPAEEPRLIA